MATNTTANHNNMMSPVATHDTSRTAALQPEPVVNEKKGIFGRRHHQAQAPVDARQQSVAPHGPYGKNFHFGQWLKLNLLDLITFAAMGAIGLGVYEANPAPTRNFPIYNNNSEVVYPQ
ncbi:hypothetical protein QFC22_005598 [Naganishia vaughanmartiniae]|uniref:Uncharacterized protein n=1 Tax=Naganishia vaughanmartiniae TaxID=1424756 RepID=A0ACC2WW06_9TREE|nr:hypothetical protein QFC22_005598 [Naganishia vaughanmartiniae]